MKNYFYKIHIITGILALFMLTIMTTGIFALPSSFRSGKPAQKATPQESMMIAAFFILITSAAPFYYYKKQQRKYNLGRQFIERMSDQGKKQKILMSISGKETSYLRSRKIYKAIAISMIVVMISYFFQIQNVLLEFIEFLVLPLIFLHMAFGAKMILALAGLNTSMGNSDKSVSDYFAAEGLSGIFGILFGKSFVELENSFNFNTFDIPRTTPIVCPSCGGKINETNPEKCQYCGSVLNLSDLNQTIEEDNGSMTTIYKKTNYKFDKNMSAEEKKKIMSEMDKFFD